MKFFNIKSLLESIRPQYLKEESESEAESGSESSQRGSVQGIHTNQYQSQQVGNLMDIKVPIVRLVDYLSIGLSEPNVKFTHVGNQDNDTSLMISRSGGRGGYSTHRDIILSCVNTVLTQKGKSLFGYNFPITGNAVPKFPYEFKGGDDSSKKKQMDFLLSCPLKKDYANKEIKFTNPTTEIS